LKLLKKSLKKNKSLLSKKISRSKKMYTQKTNSMRKKGPFRMIQTVLKTLLMKIGKVSLAQNRKVS
jgi:hypothetical protein